MIKDGKGRETTKRTRAKMKRWEDILRWEGKGKKQKKKSNETNGKGSRIKRV